MIKLLCAFFFQALLLSSLMSKNHIVLCAKHCSCSVFFLQLRFVSQVGHCFDGSFMRKVALLFSGEQHCGFHLQ
jgi:hypothetical protein